MKTPGKRPEARHFSPDKSHPPCPVNRAGGLVRSLCGGIGRSSEGIVPRFEAIERSD